MAKNTSVTDDILKKLTALSADMQVTLAKISELNQNQEKQLTLLNDMKTDKTKTAKKSAGAKKAAQTDDSEKVLDSCAWWKKKYINDPEGTKKNYLSDKHLAAIQKEVEPRDDYKAADAQNKALIESVFIYETFLLDATRLDKELKSTIVREYKTYKDNWTKKESKPEPPTADAAPKPAAAKGKGKAKGKAKAAPKPEPVPEPEPADDDDADADADADADDE